MRIFLILAFLLGGTFAQASEKETWLDLPGGEKVFTSYQAPAAGRPTLVLFNGLTYSLSDWDAYVSALRKIDKDIGLLRFDFSGMGKTLLRGQLPVSYPITCEHQVEISEQVLTYYGIKKAYIAGLSYGGAIAVAYAARHPERVEQVILMAPYTEPLKKMDTTIRAQIQATRAANPFNPATDDELYDFFLRGFIYSTYPMLEPSVLENPFKLEAIFRMVQGVRKYKILSDVRELPKANLHLLVAGEDQYIGRDIMDRFWDGIPESVRASRIVLSDSEHKIPQAVPGFAAAWTVEILNGRSELQRGLTFQGDTRSYRAHFPGGEIELPRAGK